MKIFSSEQIKKCDEFTILNEPVTSVHLMERAAQSAVDWILKKFGYDHSFHFFCGNGNNGGDGFAMARMLYHCGFDVTVFIGEENQNFSKDAEINFHKVKQISGIDVLDFDAVKGFEFKNNSVIIDALFGTGLNRNIEGKTVALIKFLNQLSFPKISIDIPSGMFADKITKEDPVVFKADETLSFQFWKKSFLHPETGVFCGNINILDIGLGKEFIQKEPSENFVIDETLVRNIYKPHNEFSNKGTYGKTTVVAGSFGKMGAAVLATKAALKSGSGLTFTLSPKCGYEILQTTCPEAMYLYGGEDFISHFDVEENSVVGIGPGLGTDPETENTFLEFLKNYSKPLVLDADALNIISKNPGNLKFIPKNAIITPHPKEFERLFGKTENSFDRLELSKKKSEELEIFIVLKDHHTQIITPENKVYYNITGNSGMAQGGSGDVLLGLITSLLAQNYSPKNASIFGVWLHGKAGDFAAEKHSKEAMLPSDLIDELGNAFKTLKK